jgi:nicotinate-nucleotide pyrophosphorylase (carboxylating)
VKDNHLVGLTIAEAVARARHAWPGRGVEVECDRPEQVDEAVTAGADLVMLDNFSPDAARDAVATVRSGARPETLVEVSGGVTLDAVPAYAAAGADLLSTSVITQSVAALDLGLDLDSVEIR